MSRCVGFDYFGVDCEKQSVSKATPPGAVVYHLGPSESRGRTF